MRHSRSHARPLVALAALSVLGAGCGGAGGGGAAASCAGIVVRAGVTYVPQGIDDPVPGIGPVLTARTPACDDTPGEGDPGVPASTVRVRAIDGVPARDALWAVDAPAERPGRYLVYVRHSFMREGETTRHALRRLWPTSGKAVTPTGSAP